MSIRSNWPVGLGVGFVAAVAGIVALLIAGTVGGRGVGILADAGSAAMPSLFRSATHASAVVAYLVVHTAIYLVAGVAALALVGLADRAPAVTTALIFVVLIIELGFLMLITVTQAGGRVDAATWRALIVAHLVADIVFALGVVAAHPSIRRDMVEGYEGTGK
jgi:hypothetical protein